MEFYQVTLKAGANVKIFDKTVHTLSLSLHEVQHLSLFGCPPRLLPLCDYVASLATDSYMEDQERVREERLSRILGIKRELVHL